MALAPFELLEACDMEEVEVTETDAALLRELLLDDQSEKKEHEDENHDRVIKQINELNAVSNGDNHDDHLERAGDEGLLDHVEALQLQLHCWPDVVGFSPAVDETMACYVEDMIMRGEFDCDIDYSQLYSGVYFEEETAYGCLWQD